MQKSKDYIHGDISDKFLDWYLENSGTFWNGHEWVVDGDEKELIKYTAQKSADGHEKGDIIELNVLKSEAFQEKMIRAKQNIKAQMGSLGSYIISNDDIFELIKDGKTTINYENKGQKFVKEITK